MDACTGEIRVFAGVRPPSGWIFCDGRALAISEYQALYSLIGVTYGGDGRSNFCVPNLQGRVVIGQGQGTGLPSFGTIGATGGAEKVQLTEANIPAHTHTLTEAAKTVSSNSSSPAGNFIGVGSATSFVPKPTGSAPVAMSSSSVSSVGSGANVAVVQPSLVLNFMICLNGIYPDFQ
jgi:microcystin-dependent protein